MSVEHDERQERASHWLNRVEDVARNLSGPPNRLYLLAGELINAGESGAAEDDDGNAPVTVVMRSADALAAAACVMCCWHLLVASGSVVLKPVRGDEEATPSC